MCLLGYLWLDVRILGPKNNNKEINKCVVYKLKNVSSDLFSMLSTIRADGNNFYNG